MTQPLPTIARHVIGSGLRVITVHMPQVRTSVIEYVSEAGSCFDAPGQPGICHFLEHMLYRGTPSHPGSHELALAFERKGGLLEAATYIDHGSVALSIPPENLVSVLPSFCEVIRVPLLQGLEVERAIVREEILENLDDSGRLVAADDIARQMDFGTHPLAHPITGTLEALERFDEPLLRTHHDQLYVADASVICVAGPIEPDAVVAALAKELDRMPRGVRPTVPAPPEPHGPLHTFVRYSDSQSHLRVVFRAPGYLDSREPALEMILRLVDDGMSTRLYHRICNTLGLCYDVSAYYESWSDAGVVEFAGDCAHEQVGALSGELFDIVRQLRDDGPTREEFEAAQQRVVWQHRELLDDPAELTGFHAYAELKGTTFLPMTRAEQLVRVTMEELRQAARDLFTARNLTVVCVGEPKKRVRDLVERQIRDFV
jgi:predicted Zn-dependent peptidase